VFKDISTVTDFRSHFTEEGKICEETMKYTQNATTYIKIGLGYINHQTCN
jgi:hypothetical protein